MTARIIGHIPACFGTMSSGERKEVNIYGMEAIGKAIQYIKEHITDELTVDMVADYVNISSFYFQKGFAMLCGFILSEYIRNRRLALAGNDLATGDERIIDIAMKYGYDSPDSFTKAFSRFHGVTGVTKNCLSIGMTRMQDNINFSSVNWMPWKHWYG